MLISGRISVLVSINTEYKRNVSIQHYVIKFVIYNELFVINAPFCDPIIDYCFTILLLFVILFICF